MGFMKPYIYSNMTGWQVETDNGTEFLPGDVVPVPSSLAIGATIDGEDSILDSLHDYCEGKIQSAEVVQGYFGRYSADGYMDCTSWDFDTDKQALADRLDEYYGDEDES